MRNTFFNIKENTMKKPFRPGLPLRAALLWVSLLTAALPCMTRAGQLPQVPTPGMVTMVDLGAKKCIPCKMMAPIIEELAQEYQGRAAVLFIDVWENPDAGQKFNLRTIPTQIFYDVQGNEISRHEGFMDKASIIALLRQQGVK